VRTLNVASMVSVGLDRTIARHISTSGLGLN